MYCRNCGKEIGKNKNFYEIRLDLFCDECVKEIKITHYIIQKKGYEDVEYEPQEVEKYKDINQLKQNLIKKLEKRQKIIAEIEQMEYIGIDDYAQLLWSKDNIEDIKSLLDKIEGDDK